MAVPKSTVEIAFNAGYTTPAASRTWTDVTAYVELQAGISINRGRAEEEGQPQPSRLTLTLNNRDGRFTPEYAAGAYYPNVKKGRPIRVRSEWPIGSGTWYDRITGYIDEWPVEWPGGSDAWSTVTVTASSRMARSARTATFKSIVEEEILYDIPTLYYPLSEPAGALEAGNIAPGRSERLVVTQLGSGGTLEFGAGIGPGTDDLSAPILTPVSKTNGLNLQTALAQPLAGAGDGYIALEAWFVVTAGGGTDDFLVSLMTNGGDNTLSLGIDSTGMPYVRWDGTTTFTSTQPLTTARDGNLHHLVGLVSLLDPTDNVSLQTIYDGVNGTLVAASWPLLAGGVPFFPPYTRVIVGGSSTGRLITGTIAHAAIYRRALGDFVNGPRWAEHYHSGADGFTADASGARVARYARLAGIPTAEVTVEAGLSGSIAHKDTTGETPVGLMQDVATTEDGLVFDGKDGTLTFHARSHRYGSTSAFTLDAAAGDIEQGLLPKLDDNNLSNDVTATRPGGAEAHAVNQASIDEYGFYRETLEVLTTSDNEVQSRAHWQVSRFGTPRVTIPNVANDLTSSSSAKVTALLAADIGTRFTVSNMPSQAPATTMDFFIEGVTETIGAESHGIEFNTSAAAYANVWILGSATASQLGSTTVLAY